MFHVAAISFSACKNSVHKIVNSSAEVRISVDSSDVADDGFFNSLMFVVFLCKSNPLNVPK